MNGGWHTLSLASVLARRELRGGLSGFRVFLACLVLGVASIGAVASLSAAMQAGLERDGSALLGGDVSLSRTHEAASAPVRAWLAAEGPVSERLEMRAMARRLTPATRPESTDRTVVEFKAVDDAYPLYGTLVLSGGVSQAEALEQRDGIFGAVVEDRVLVQLGMEPGARVRVGDAELEVRAAIVDEPDRVSSRFAFGPRMLVSRAALDATGLLQPGSLARFRYAVQLPEGTDADAWADRFRSAFPEESWRIRDARQAAPGLLRVVDQTTMFLTLVGFAALLVGGVGVANAVRSYLDGKTRTIATLKGLGASSRLIFTAYLMQTLALASLAIVIGLTVGAGAPALGAWLLGSVLPAPIEVGLYPQALALAAAYGVLVTLVFSLWPLGQARRVPPGSLFRESIAPSQAGPGVRVALATAATAALLTVLTIAAAADPVFAGWFVVGAVGALLAFRLAGRGIVALAARAGRPRRPALRLALSNIHRPGAPTPSIVMSLGLGLTVLVAVVLVEVNLSRQLADEWPSRAPAFFFIDIQADQAEAFDEVVAAVPGAGAAERVASLRGRIVSVKGVAAEDLTVSDDARWALRGDRGLTFADRPPRGTQLVAGEWWPPDYAGPPLLSMDAEIAEGFGVGLGDTVTFRILGREITGTIANLRTVDWRSFGINFVFLFSPGILDAAPYTFIATVEAPPSAERALMTAVTDRFANISAVPVRDALDTVNQLVQRLAGAVRATAGVALLAGALVLAGALAAGHRRRIYDAVVLKVVGATRPTVVGAFMLEYVILGAVTGLLAAVVGSVAAWAVIALMMQSPFVLEPLVVGGTVLGCIAITIAFGLAGTWQALGAKAAPLLRNE